VVKTAYLFAGQGSQYVGMGKDLYETFPESQAVFDKADEVLGFSLTRLCFEGPAQDLKQTQNAQPAILTMSIAAWEAFRKSTRVSFGIAGDSLRSQGHPSASLGTPFGRKGTSYAAGLSLGEYSALVAAGALCFEDAVYLVRKRGEFMEEESLKKPGKMLSIIGLDVETVRQICRETQTEIANLNCPGQVVISGDLDNIEKALILAKQKSARMAVLLEVSGAFHSSFMKGASVRLAAELEKAEFKTPDIPVISNVTAKPAATIREIKDNLIKQVASSVLWEDSMKFLLSQGIREFIELGPGNVLKGLMRRTEAQAQVVNIEKKEDILNFKTRGEEDVP
jgi:[acyl-carrier-protein] S-malonyltransferase